LRSFHSQQIEKFSQEGAKPVGLTPHEDPEQQLIVEANEIASTLWTEITTIHKFLRDIYVKRFPELEQMILHPLDYIRAAKKIRNEIDITKVDLSDTLPQNTIMSIQMAATISPGIPLNASDLQKCEDACEVALSLEQARQRILDYVQSRMNLFAPNLTIILGPTVAAQMIGAAGGLLQLSRMPSSNVLVMGHKKGALAGFSSASRVRHIGFVWGTELVQTTEPSFRTQASRLVANKCALAARVDNFKSDPAGNTGRKLREAIEARIEKLEEPLPSKQEKAIVIDDRPRKRRGGRKHQKMKNAYAMTELQKRANRMAFGQASEDVLVGGALRNLGMLGTNEGSGLLRMVANRDDKGFKIKKPKERKLKGGRTAGGALGALLGNNTAVPGGSATLISANTNPFGTATSIYVTTPGQGMELRVVPTPTATKSSGHGNDGYFSTLGGFSTKK
jgi:U4/U6 small nuclear ribonucleoprotein PRP31